MVTRALLFVHRWLGVALCLVFLLWFPSGIGMMYWGFPTVTAADRLERSAALDPSSVVLSPVEAVNRAGLRQLPSQVRLNTFDGRPVYRFRTGRGGDTLVYADTGDQQVAVSRELMARVAAAWTGQPARAATVEQLEDVDQWSVQAQVRSAAPLWKYSWPDGEQVYVSELSGEVVQYTTTASRVGAYLGQIPHWLYFTPLRKHGPEWTRVVIWSSGIGAFAAIVGLIIGVCMYSPSKQYRVAGTPTSIPYRGLKRWHIVLGLVLGVATATWAFSGMLSMDPFPTRSGDGLRAARATNRIPQALGAGAQLSDLADVHPREALQRVPFPVKELEWRSFAGEPIFMAMLTRGETRVIPLHGPAQTEFDHQRIVDVVTEAALPSGLAEVRLVTQYDRYYLDRRLERPLPVILARVDDPDNNRYYIDPRTARIVGSYSSRNWVTRWAYHGLHSLDFPWLYNYRPAWDIVVIAFMLGGTTLCVTSLVLAWRVVGKKLEHLSLRPTASYSSSVRRNVGRASRL